MGMLNRVRYRILQECLEMDPIIEAPAPREDWAKTPACTSTASATATATTTHDELHLRVLSLNAWILPVAPKCTERAEVIAKALDDQWDVVILQEIWHMRERNLLIRYADQAGFHYHHYFNVAPGFPLPFGVDTFGTGLLVLSRFPIVSAMYHAFSLSGRPYALHEADYIAHKGAGLLHIQTPAGIVDLYATHLVSNYNELGKPGPGDFYYAQRVAEAYELARLIKLTHKHDLVLLCGDFNSPPDSTPVRVPRDLMQFRDAFTDMNNEDGITFGNPDNTFSNGEYPMRMDYIMYKILQQSKDTPSWHLVGSGIQKGFYKDKNGDEFPWSDHFGVTAEFVFGIRPVPLKPCEQALGEASKEQLSPMSKSSSTRMRMCPTTTCIHCDAVLAKAQGTVLDKSGYPSSVRCLQEIQHVLLEGHSQSVACRAANLRRSAIAFGLFMCWIVTHLFSLVPMTALSWIAFMGLTSYCLIQYFLAFFFRSLECSAFAELISNVRLHLMSEQTKYPVACTCTAQPSRRRHLLSAAS